MKSKIDTQSVTRRSFLVGGASAAAAMLTVAGEASAQAKKPAAKAPAKKPAAAPAKKPAAAKPAQPAQPAAKAEEKKPPVNCAVIGLGPHGREVLSALSRANGANIVSVCDTYAAFLRRGAEGAPKAAAVDDYRKVLENKDVQAVVIATPTHQHKEIALAAIQAGKHVYCETPLAHTIEDARAIATAAKDSKQIFQVGQQYRANPQHHHVHHFIRSAVLGNVTHGRAQWHKKNSWKRGAPTDQREREINWRLDKAISPGLIGEIGIHSLDIANWFFNSLPVSVQGFGAVMAHRDGREVPDTIQCVLEYQDGLRFYYDATLTNSFDGQYEVFLGTDSAVLVRDERAWMFKEADAPLLGWEVYARKEQVGDETGIALVADASKQLVEGKLPSQSKPSGDPGRTALFFALEDFLNCIRENRQPHCGPVQGYQAVVTALKANEAVVNNTKITYQKEWFTL